MINKEQNSGAQTPQETNEAMRALANTLEEMDKAEGVFGEAMLDEELEMVAGGWPGKTLYALPPSMTPYKGISYTPPVSTGTPSADVPIPQVSPGAFQLHFPG